MKKLYVLYDHGCGLCVRAARWLRSEPKYIPLELMPAMSQQAWARFPFLKGTKGPPGEVLVVSDEGELYRGPSAWIMCLFALKRYRGLALRLAQPKLMPLTHKVIQMLSHNRMGISRLLDLPAERMGEAAAWAPNTWTCRGEACRVGQVVGESETAAEGAESAPNSSTAHGTL